MPVCVGDGLDSLFFVDRSSDSIEESLSYQGELGGWGGFRGWCVMCAGEDVVRSMMWFIGCAQDSVDESLI